MTKKNQKIRESIDPVIEKLQTLDINHNDWDIEGIGDVLEKVLCSFGITEERFKWWFDLEECGCTERKKWLNGLFGWRKDK